MQAARKKKNVKQRKLAENENDPESMKLIRYGGSYPHVPGLIRSPVPLAPSAMRVVLRYSERVTLTNTSGVFNSYVFTGNGAYDPNVTGTGAQPMGFDQWSTLFTRYRVIASTILATPTTPAGATNAAVLLNTVIVPTNLANTFSGIDDAACAPYAKRQVVNGVGGGVGPFRPIRSSMETDLIQGISKEAVIADDTLSALTSANPANMWYWQLIQEPTDRATTTTGTWDVSVYYLIDFFERSLLTLSSAMPAIRKIHEQRQSRKPVPQNGPSGFRH